jgi:hypothetical protein
MDFECTENEPASTVSTEIGYYAMGCQRGSGTATDSQSYDCSTGDVVWNYYAGSPDCTSTVTRSLTLGTSTVGVL